MKLRDAIDRIGASVELAPSDWRWVDIHRFGLESKPRIWVVIDILHYRILSGDLQMNEETL